MRYSFSSEKNSKLINERDISFEEIIAAIHNDQIIEIIKHPNESKYKNQQIYVVYAKEYIYLVPFVSDVGGNVFLKTIIPSRKAKKRYGEFK